MITARACTLIVLAMDQKSFDTMESIITLYDGIEHPERSLIDSIITTKNTKSESYITTSTYSDVYLNMDEKSASILMNLLSVDNLDTTQKEVAERIIHVMKQQGIDKLLRYKVDLPNGMIFYS